MATKQSKWPQSIPNGHKRHENFELQGLSKYTRTQSYDRVLQRQRCKNVHRNYVIA
jgi:hypothetical protein